MLANILARANCLCYLIPTDSCEVLTRKLDSFLTKQKKSKSAKNEDHHSTTLSDGAKKRANHSDIELVAMVPNPGSGGDVDRRATGGGNVSGVVGRSRKRENDEVSSASNNKRHKKKRRRTPTPETTSSADSSDD